MRITFVWFRRLIKVFRSTDYNSLVWVFEKFFDRVEAFKPKASRQQSAEIFVICQGYRAPPKIDSRFFNPKVVFKESEADIFQQISGDHINSLKKIFQIKKSKKIADVDGTLLFRKIPLNEFIKIDNPFAVFVHYNKIDIDDPKFFERISKFCKLPRDFKENAADLKLLGKREVSNILKWREKVKAGLNRDDKEKRRKEFEKENKEKQQAQGIVEEGNENKNENQNENENEKNEDEKLNAEAKEMNKKKLKQQRYERKQKEKSLLQFISRRVRTEDVVMETMGGELGGFDFSEAGGLVGKKRAALEKIPGLSKEEKDQMALEEEKQELDRILSKGRKRVKLANREELNANLELNYENNRKIKEENQIQEEKASKHKRNQKLGKVENKRRNFDIKRFEEDKKNKEQPEAKVEGIIEEGEYDLAGFEDNAEEQEINQEEEGEVDFETIKTKSKFFSKKIFGILDDGDLDLGLDILIGSESENEEDGDKNDVNADQSGSEDEESKSSLKSQISSVKLFKFMILPNSPDQGILLTR